MKADCKYRVKEDCFCEGYLHEKINYPREGLVEKKLLKGDIVEFREEWSNFYGSYMRVLKDGRLFDIQHKYLERYFEPIETEKPWGEALYTEKEVEELLSTQRGNCYVAVLTKTRSEEIAESAVKAPEPSGGKWRKGK